MRFEQFLKHLAPLVMMSLGASLAGCGGVKVNMGDTDGVPLPELDLSGPAPTKLALASGDTVILTEGEALSITIEGDDTAKEDLRFVHKDKLLGIARSSGLMSNGGAPATIRVTMARPSELIIGGKGTIAAQGLAAKAKLVIGGSGDMSFEDITAEQLEIVIGGSGKVKGAGSAQQMDISIGGQGTVDLAGLKAERATISIGGSGDVAFASDGTVEANIGGSGKVKVKGRAKCTSKSFGTGQLICEP